MHTTAREVQPKKGSRRFSPVSEMLAGAVTSLICLVYAVSCAALVYSGSLTAHVGMGMVSALFTASVLGGMVAWRSSLPFALAGPDTRAAAILAAAVPGVVAGLSPQATASAAWAIVLLSGLATGVFLYVLGRLKLSRLIRFIPYPAVGGFLAGTGWLLVTGAYKTMTGGTLAQQSLSQVFQSSTTPVWIAGALFGVVIQVVLKIKPHFLALPTLLGVGMLGAFGGLRATGMTLAQARSLGWFFELAPTPTFWEAWAEVRWEVIPWGEIVQQSGNLLALALVMAITILLSATSLELKTGRNADLDHELRVNGLGNLFSGLGGGMAGCLSINRTLLSYQASARTRFAGFVTVAVCATVLILRVPVLDVIPKPLLGGLLFYLGLHLLHEWLVENWSRLSRVDYGIVVVILLAVASFGFIPGMLLGVVLAAISFAINYSRISVIKHALNGTQHRSNVERSPAEQAMLDEHGRSIQVFWLHGYLFFGTANRLVEVVLERLKGVAGERAEFVVLDFGRVTGVDSSATMSFAKMRQLAWQHGAVILFCHMPEGLEESLQSSAGLAAVLPPVQTFRDVDYALEWCEDRILSRMDPATAHSIQLEEILKSSFHDEERARDFVSYLEQMTVPAGHYLCRENEPSTGMYFVEKGRVSVGLELAGGQFRRIRSMGAGTVVGEMGLILNTSRTAAVIADEPTLLYQLTNDSLSRLEREKPEVAGAFQQLLLKMLARRLTAANREIRELLD